MPSLDPKKEYVHVDPRSRRVEATQWLGRPIGEVFEFFSDAHNLERITPPFLNFHITSVSTPVIGENTLIHYLLKLRGIPMKWTSRIENWRPPYFFSDSQVRGPYRRWFHEHEFREAEGGTWIVDRVSYGLPLDPLGSAVLGKFVASDIERIFKFRIDAIKAIFK